MNKKDLRLIFIGTPQFAAFSLEKILENDFNVVAVITAPDKPAGRGYQIQESEVKKCALKHNLPVLQPTNLKNEDFLKELYSYKPDLQIVIAFRMLPTQVWEFPPLGTFNLHASLLPQYRGAAPINWAIINGEKTTGVTTFFLKHQIDTGDIILQKEVVINENDNVGILHDKLMVEGADLVLDSLNLILENKVKTSIQDMTLETKHAPKIFKNNCLINWNKTADEVLNLIRGLSPYPAAFTHFNGKILKIFEAKISEIKSDEIGKFEVVEKKLFVNCSDLKLELLEVQFEGKKRTMSSEFINGLKIANEK